LKLEEGKGEGEGGIGSSFGVLGGKAFLYSRSIYQPVNHCSNPRHSQKERKFRVDIIKCDR
jgi:hypothetical protein